MSGIATSDKLAHELGRSAETEQPKFSSQEPTLEVKRQIGGEPIQVDQGKQKGLTSNKELFPEPNKTHQPDSTGKLLSQGEKESRDKPADQWINFTSPSPAIRKDSGQQEKAYEAPRKDKHELPTKDAQDVQLLDNQKINSETLNMDKPQLPSQKVKESQDTPQENQSDKQDASQENQSDKQDQKSEETPQESSGGVISGITGFISSTVRGTVATLLSPITGIISPRPAETDNKNNENDEQSQSDNSQEKGDKDQTQQESQKKQKEDNSQQQEQQGQKTSDKQEGEQKQKKQKEDNSQQQEQQGEKTSAKQEGEQKQKKDIQTKAPGDSSLRSLIGSGKNVQLIYGGRCLAVQGKQVIVEETAPSQAEQNTFNIELIKEDEDLVRIRSGDLFLTADRNVGMLMAPEDSGKINSFHLERSGDMFALRAHNEQKWVGVGLKAEKKDTTREQHGIEVERDGQLFIEVNKCYQFDMQSDHIWMRLSFL